MRKSIAAATLVMAGLGCLGIQPAAAAPPGIVADVEILPTARLSDGGSAIVVRVRSLCQPNGIQWEGFIDAAQGETATHIGLPLVCDGRPHVQAIVLPVGNPDGPEYTVGNATIRVSIIDEDTLTLYDSDTETVWVR